MEYIQTNEPMVEKSDVVFACVKPHILLPALKSLSDRLNDKLLVSIAAGITLDQIQQVRFRKIPVYIICSCHTLHITFLV